MCTEWLKLSFPVTLEKYQFLADRMGHDFGTGHDVGGASGKEPACRCRRHEICGFDPGIRTIPWRREQQPTPVFLPGESHGQRSLVGYGPEGRKESDRTEVTEHAHALIPKGPSVADAENVTHMTQCTFKTPKETPKGVLRHNA